jgi:hypothetical protein
LYSLPCRWPCTLLLCIGASTRWHQTLLLPLQNITKFLVKEEVKPAKFLHRLNTQYVEEKLSCASVYVGTVSFLKAVKKS